MPQESAGIILYRRRGGEIEVLLAHPGGPYWRSRDEGAWAIPKGQVEPGEDAAAAALREFEEELGAKPRGEAVHLCRIRQKGGKWVDAFAIEGDFDPATLTSNPFQMEWPPRSGRFESFPEVDRAGWFSLPEARVKMLESQLPILDRLEELLGA